MSEKETVRQTEDETKIQELQTEIAKVRQKIFDKIRKRFIKCTKCGKKSRVASWIFIQKYYYVEPFSCTGGDRYLSSDMEVCYIKCPKCKEKIYIHTHPQKEAILEMIKNGGGRIIFNSIEDSY